MDGTATLDDGAGTLDETEATDADAGTAFDISLPAGDEATGVTFLTLAGIVLRGATNEHEN